jgi:hypothetical protein
VAAVITHAAAADGLALCNVARLNNLDVIALALGAFHAALLIFTLLNVLTPLFGFPHIVLCAFNIPLAVAVCKRKSGVLFNTKF